MKKVISILSVMAFLFSGYVQAEQDEELVSVCKEVAEREEISPDMTKEFIDQCIKDIMADEQKEKMESKQDS